MSVEIDVKYVWITDWQLSTKKPGRTARLNTLVKNVAIGAD